MAELPSFVEVPSEQIGYWSFQYGFVDADDVDGTVEICQTRDNCLHRIFLHRRQIATFIEDLERFAARVDENTKTVDVKSVRLNEDIRQSENGIR